MPAASAAVGWIPAALVASVAARNEARGRGEAAQRRIQTSNEQFNRDVAWTGRAWRMDAQGQRALMNHGVGPTTEGERKAAYPVKTARTMMNVARGAQTASLGATLVAFVAV